ncbi:MAG: hypothetical protein K2Y04_06945 [Caulobacteraceae bacterium]|nr:hypothetical protein [Caulobacteraceae bacterium]
MIRRPYAIAVSLFLALGSASACASQESPEQFSLGRTDSALMFSGLITPATADAIQRELRDGDVLFIKSPGGHRQSTAVLGQDITSRQVSVKVNSDCFSACALYLALPAHETVVPEGATLLFHNDTSMWMELATARPGLLNPEELQAIQAGDSVLKALLETRNIDPAILACITSALKPDYAGARRAGPIEAAAHREDDQAVIVPTRYDFAWLSPAVLAHFGATNVRVEWVVSAQARTSYEATFGKSIAWVDTPAQCDAA